MSKSYIPARDAFPTRMPRRRMLPRRAPTVRKLARRVRKLEKQDELKFLDTSLSAALTAGTTDMSGLEFDPSATSMVSTPAVGDDASSRDGKQIYIKSLQVTGSVTFAAQADQTAADTECPVHIWIVLDKQSNAAQLNSEDVLINPVGSGAGQPLKDLTFGNRFRVLRHKVIQAQLVNMAFDGTNIEQQGVIRLFSFFIRFKKPLVVNFNAGTTASIANVVDNSLHVLAWNTHPTIARTLAYNARIRFVG